MYHLTKSIVIMHCPSTHCQIKGQPYNIDSPEQTIRISIITITREAGIPPFLLSPIMKQLCKSLNVEEVNL